jgi:hypothetical protein
MSAGWWAFRITPAFTELLNRSMAFPLGSIATFNLPTVNKFQASGWTAFRMHEKTSVAIAADVFV